MFMKSVGMAGILALVAMVPVGMLYSQEHGGATHGGATHDEHGAKVTVGEVFCSHMSVGQLCPGGAPDVLKLSGAKKQQWTETLKSYNKAVDAATKQLLVDSKGTLSPEEYAQVESWFKAGALNSQINELLAAKTTAAK